MCVSFLNFSDFFPLKWGHAVQIICVHQRDSITEVYVDGTTSEAVRVTAITVDTEMNLGTVAATGIQIGNGLSGSPLFSGEIAEVLLYK